MYGRQSIPMKPIANMVRHQKRMKAVLTATHLCGLSAAPGAEITVELLEPSKEPFFPQDDHRFKLEGLSTPEQPDEPILSIYSSGLPDRIRIPMSQITDVAIISATSLAGKTAAPDSPLSKAYPDGLPDPVGVNHLILLRKDREPIVLAYPRRVRGARKIAEYYCIHTRPGKDPLALADLGVQ